MTTITVSTPAHDAWVDITRDVQETLQTSGIREGAVILYVPHTTAAITVQENADPPLRDDLTKALARLFPWQGDYGHCEDNAAAHMKAVTVGPSLHIPVREGRLALGTWQAIYFCEFDGPRQRRVEVSLLSA